MSGFDPSHNGAFFNFSNLTPQQLNMLRQQSQMQQAVQMPQQQQQPQTQQPQPPPNAQQQMQQRNPMMPQLGLPAGFNQQQLQAFMAQQQSQLANGMMANNQNPLMQMMRPQSMVQPPQQQQQQQQPQMQAQQPQQQQPPQLQNQMAHQQASTSQPAHLQQQQQPQQAANMGAAPQMGGAGAPTPTFAQLSHAIEQAKKGNLTQEQMIQLRQLISRQQAMQAQQQAAPNQNTGARPLQSGQANMNMGLPNGQNFANAMQRTPQMQAQAQMMAGLQQIRPGNNQSTPTMGAQGFLQPTMPAQQNQQQSQQQAQQSNQAQSSPQISLQGPPQMNQQQMARPQQIPGLQQQQNTSQQQQMMGQQPAQPGQQRPPAGRPDPTPGPSNQQNPLNFLRLLHQRVTDIESKLTSDLSAEERQAVQQQHAEAKRLQQALLQRLNVQNASQFAALMQQSQQAAGQMPNNNGQQQQAQQQPIQPPQPSPQQQQQQQGVGVMGNAVQASPIIRPPTRPGSARPPQGQFGSPMLNQPGVQPQNAQQAPPQQQPQVRPSPQMGAMNIAGQAGGMSGLQGVPSLRPEQFNKALVDLMKKRGTPITSLPKVGGRDLDLYRFYQIVQAHGGSEGAHQKNAWPAIAMSLELAPLGSPQTQTLGQALAVEYRNYLAPFEETWQRAMQHQYQMSMATAGLNQTQNTAQANAQAPSFRPPSTPQMQSQQANQQSTHMQGPQASMMPPSQSQQQQQQPQQMQTQNAPQGVGLQQPSLAGFNPPPPPILSAENLAKVGMTQEQFNKVFYGQQLNAWRQEQIQNQQRQMSQGFQTNQSGPGPNGLQQPPQAQQLQQQQLSQGPMQQQQQQGQTGWPNQQRPILPQTSGAQPSQTQTAGFGANMPGQPLNAQQMQNPGQMGINVQNQQAGPPQQPQSQQSQMPNPNQSQQQSNAPIITGSNAPGAQQGQMAGRPSNMSQARFIAVSPEQLEQARAAMQKIDQELATQRPRLPIIQNIADDERDQILDQVQKLAPIQATVTALLPAFYAMNGNLEPAKRLKIMAFMYKDQYDLLAKKQCILRLADLDKLKMQMSRCISFVRSSNPELAQRIVTSLGEQNRAAQQNGVAPSAAGSGASAVAAPIATQAAPVRTPAAASAAPTEAASVEAAAGVNADGTFDAAAAMHGIKRGLRPENLKLPPNKRAKNVPGAGKAMSPSSAANESPRVAPSPAQAEDPATPAGSTPAGKGGKKNEKATKAGKTTAKKGKGAAGTPTSSAAEPDKRFKTSADIMAEVKREMAEAERKRREEGSAGAGAGDAASAAAKLDLINVKAEQEADEKRRKDQELAGRDPAGLVESTWQELLATGNTNNGTQGPNGFGGDNSLLGAPSAGSSAQNGSDPKALQSLMSMLGQDSMMSGLPSNGINVPSRGLMTGAGSGGSSFLDGALDSLPSADADTGLDIDLFDFIEASAAGPDAFNDDIDLSGVFGSSAVNASTQESEPPVETPELVASAKLPGGSSNASSASNSTSNSLRSKLPTALGASGLDFGSAGPSSTSPAEMSSCDEIDLEKSPFVHRMRLDRIGLTMAPAVTGPEAAAKTTSAAAESGSQSTLKAAEETAINQVELGPGSQSLVAASGDEWWEMDHFASMGSGGYGSDPNADQPWAVLS